MKKTLEERARGLLEKLLKDPRRIAELGAGYGLLECYFSGYPIETLRPLLRHADPFVQRTALFVTSELGAASLPVMGDITPLLHSPDPIVQLEAMDTIAGACRGAAAPDFVHVALMLDSPDRTIRERARELIEQADPAQLTIVRRHFGRTEEANERSERGAPSPSGAAGLLIEPAPLSVRFTRSFGAPVHLGDALVHRTYVWVLQGRCDVRVTRLRARATPTQGFNLSIAAGTMRMGSVSTKRIVLWADTSPEATSIGCFPRNPNTELRLWNSWKSSSGDAEAWSGSAGMLVEGSRTGVLLRCSGGEHDEPDFDDLVVRTIVEPTMPRSRGKGR